MSLLFELSSSSDDDDDDFTFLSGASTTKLSSAKSTKSVNKNKPKIHGEEEINFMDELSQLSQPLTDSQSTVAVASQPSDHPVSSKKTTSSAAPTNASLPFVFSSKINSKNSTILVQLEDSNLDLSGDVGAVGRLHCKTNDTLMLDIKGHQYTGDIVPCASFMIVSMTPTEAKVDAVLNDFCQISRKKNVFDSLKGVVTQGIMDESYQFIDTEDVNKKHVGETTAETSQKSKGLVVEKKKKSTKRASMTESSKSKKIVKTKK